MLRQRRGRRLHRSPGIACRTGAYPEAVKHPLFVNMLTGGVTPILSVMELEQLGYKNGDFPHRIADG